MKKRFLPPPDFQPTLAERFVRLHRPAPGVSRETAFLAYALLAYGYGTVAIFVGWAVKALLS